MSIESFIREDRFYHFFQPICDVKTSKNIGYEALLRTDTYPNPEIPFQMAKQEDRLFELDTRSIHKAISSFNLSGPTRANEELFLNVFPSTILNSDFPAFLDQAVSDTSLKHQQIVLEISESEVIDDMDSFKNHIFKLKQEGFLIAMDDIGTGYSNAESIIELEPDYLKLDRYFAKGLHLSRKKQEYISVFKHFCERTIGELVLEGIETEEELMMAKDLGISAAQGYYLGKPALLDKSVCI